ncbi:unnamed protein product [Caenorhabditis nigoni]
MDLIFHPLHRYGEKKYFGHELSLPSHYPRKTVYPKWIKPVLRAGGVNMVVSFFKVNGSVDVRAIPKVAVVDLSHPTRKQCNLLMKIESSSEQKMVFKKAHPPRRRNIFQRIRGAYRLIRKRILRERDHIIISFEFCFLPLSTYLTGMSGISPSLRKWASGCQCDSRGGSCRSILPHLETLGTTIIMEAVADQKIVFNKARQVPHLPEDSRSQPMDKKKNSRRKGPNHLSRLRRRFFPVLHSSRTNNLGELSQYTKRNPLYPYITQKRLFPKI